MLYLPGLNRRYLAKGFYFTTSYAFLPLEVVLNKHEEILAL